MEDWSTVYIEQIEDCENRQSKMTDWEVGFISSIRSQIEDGKRPTPKQIETLDNIWEKITSKG